MNKEKEVLEELEKLKKYSEILKNPDEFFQHMQGHRTELSFVLSAFTITYMSETVKVALEKRIPKKIDKIGNKCPVCSVYLASEPVGDHYCFNCGQAIDWDQ